MRLKLKKLKSYKDKTGSLVPLYKNKTLENFDIKRFFFILGKTKYTRANHAHKKCDQIYIPVQGEISVETIKKKQKKKFIISEKNKKILFVPKLTWTSIKFLKKKSLLMVLCNYKYDRKEYIEDIMEILK